MYYERELETLPVEELKKLQSERLVELAKRVYENVPLYKAKFDEANIKPEDIHGLDGLSKLPFTVKTDLRDSYPFNMFAVPLKQIVRIHASSGTTGKPTTVGYTKTDLDNWQKMVARSLCCAGAEPESVVQVAFGYGMFTGGLGLNGGVEKLGASVIPMSSGNTAKQLMIMQDYQTTHLACTPSYAMYMGETMAAQGIKSTSLKGGIFGGEPWTDNLRKRIEDVLHIKAYDIYGLSEIMGPGVACECSEQNGLHIWADHFIAELIDPDTLEVLPDGSEGELVITTITKEGIPLIRYRTRDISRITWEKCACGRTHPRIARVKARSDDMLIIKGVNVFPSQIESVLLTIDEVEPYYKIIVTRENALDKMLLLVELSDKFDFDKISSLEGLAKKIVAKIDSVVGIHPEVKLVEPKSLERFAGKANRVEDLREK